MAKTLHTLRLEKRGDTIEFSTKEMKVFEENDEFVKAWNETGRHEVEYEMKKTALDIVKPVPFGQSLDHMTIFAHTLSKKKIDSLQKQMLAEMESQLAVIKDDVQRAERVVAEFKKTTFGA